jgi:hypothetical protein
MIKNNVVIVAVTLVLIIAITGIKILSKHHSNSSAGADVATATVTGPSAYEKMITSLPWEKNLKDALTKACRQESAAITIVKYCDCITQEILEQNIIKSNRDAAKESEGQFSEKIAHEIFAYMGSEPGIALVKKCRKSLK